MIHVGRLIVFDLFTIDSLYDVLLDWNWRAQMRNPRTEVRNVNAARANMIQTLTTGTSKTDVRHGIGVGKPETRKYCQTCERRKTLVNPRPNIALATVMQNTETPGRPIGLALQMQ